jgi:hypothetical protein
LVITILVFSRHNPRNWFFLGCHSYDDQNHFWLPSMRGQLRWIFFNSCFCIGTSRLTLMWCPMQNWHISSIFTTFFFFN